MEYSSTFLHHTSYIIIQIHSTQFYAIIFPQHLNSLLCLILQKSLKLFEFVKDFRLIPEEVNPCIHQEVIYK
jgi:hypothetical protein